MLVETGALKDAALNWAVATALERDDIVIVPRDKIINATGHALPTALAYPRDGSLPLRYTTDWSHGGPLIEREQMSIEYLSPDLLVDAMLTPESMDAMRTEPWMATTPDSTIDVMGFGPTPLVAAMRCFVACRLGEQVNVPDELVEDDHADA